MDGSPNSSPLSGFDEADSVTTDSLSLGYKRPTPTPPLTLLQRVLGVRPEVHTPPIDYTAPSLVSPTSTDSLHTVPLNNTSPIHSPPQIGTVPVVTPTGWCCCFWWKKQSAAAQVIHTDETHLASEKPYGYGATATS